MIKIDGVDMPRIEYIDPVDGKVSILRVMQDGVQIWPVDSGVPNTPTGIQLSEYDIVDELQIPTGITLREVIEPTYTYILDDYPGAVAAYSLRKLRTGETDAVEIRRDNDDATTIVYLEEVASITLASTVSAGGTLGDWIGANSAYVRTWYDQSGNNIDAVQTDNAIQRPLVESGILVTSENGLSALGISDGGYALTIPAGVNGAEFIEVYSVQQNYSDNASDLNIIIEQSNNAASANGSFYLGARDSQYEDLQNVSPFYSLWNVNRIADDTTNLLSWQTKMNTAYATSRVYRENSLVKANIPGANTRDTAQLLDQPAFNLIARGSTSAPFSGSFQELIMYFSDNSSNVSGIEDNINNHYGIYLTSVEVDTYIIEQDTLGVTDTVIDLLNNQPRTSASDTAVANLTARNNTIITS